MGAMVCLAFGRQEASAAQLHPPHSEPDAVQKGAARESQTAPTIDEGRLRRPGGAEGEEIRTGEVLTNNAKLKNNEAYEKAYPIRNRSNRPAGHGHAGRPGTTVEKHPRRSRRDVANFSTAPGHTQCSD